ncbi:argininosuccinate lyase [Candidatus Uzinura diaspidicola str. ASNER]|uniref:Argininosuccinate lyase n=1 Tax=Candidatus Uzinura diaspidicola str. ASNER TaxID=1133592 RepID=L7VMN0_9FLAO|nr:argininosuccinate lyase [Candidatus Uzinura diaspidicola str. ASNER]
MKLWEKNFNISKEIELFTIGNDRDIDIKLAPFDVIGTLGHIRMLESIGLLSKEELIVLSTALRKIFLSITNGNFKIENTVEDIHSQVEIILISFLGNVGMKIHSGRSRNDQVLLDLRLFIREEIQKIVNYVKPLFDIMIHLSEYYKEVLLPGYSHYQIAMPSSFGLWFSSYAESLSDDLLLLEASYRVVNKNPLGSAAGYGSSFPLNRIMTTELLGFEDMNINVIYAQMGRGKIERVVANALSNIGSTLSRFSQDVCLYMGYNFLFLYFPDHLTTGSSIMPHKKNPDVFELIRGRCNHIKAFTNEIYLITTNLSSGYHRDLQIIKESFLPIFEVLKNCLFIARYMLEHILINENSMEDQRYSYVFSVDLVNKYVQEGLSFREAYKKVGLSIQEGQFQYIKVIRHILEGSIGNLCNDSIQNNMQKVLTALNFSKSNESIDKLLKRL